MKRTLLITAMAAFSLATKAQNNNPNPKHRVFVSGGLSYAFPAASQNADSWGNPYSGTQNVTTGNFEFKKASLSSGLQGKVGIGYLFNEHVGIKMDVSIGIANKKYTYTESVSGVAGISTEESVQYAKLPVLLLPSILVQSGGTTFNIVAHGGLALPISAKTIEEYTETDASGTDFQKTETKNSLSLGFCGGLRGEYHMSKYTSLYIGLSGVMLSLTSKETELTEYTSNGINVLPYISADERIIKHEKSGTYSNTSNVYPAFNTPFSNIGLEAGFTFWF